MRAIHHSVYIEQLLYFKKLWGNRRQILFQYQTFKVLDIKHIKQCNAGFLSLSTIDIWGSMILCCRGLATINTGMFNSIHGLLSLDANNTRLHITTQNVSRGSRYCPGGTVTISCKTQHDSHIEWWRLQN